MDSEKSITEPHPAYGQNYHYPPSYAPNGLPPSAFYGHAAPTSTESPFQRNKKHFTVGFFAALLPFLPLIGLKDANINEKRGYLFMGASAGAITISFLFYFSWKILISFDTRCQIALLNNDDFYFTGCFTEDAIMVTGFSFGFLSFVYGVAATLFLTRKVQGAPASA